MGVEEEGAFRMKFSAELVVNVEVLKIGDIILVFNFDTGALVEWPVAIRKKGREMPALDLH